MLRWLRRHFDAVSLLPQARQDGPRWRVIFNENDVQLTDPSGTTNELAWAQLAYVGIITTADGPGVPDLFWMLQQHDRRTSLVIPMGAEGEHELLHEMQSRLPGFDNMTVIEAMSSTDPAGFIVWQAGETGTNAQQA